MNAIDTNISRRGLLAGLGGMTFCIAVGTDGVQPMGQAQQRAGERAGAAGPYCSQRIILSAAPRWARLDDLAAAHPR
jgi:hypothetical protein